MPEPCRDRLPMAVPSVPKIEERVAQTRVLLREEAPATQEIRTLVRRIAPPLPVSLTRFCTRKWTSPPVSEAGDGARTVAPGADAVPLMSQRRWHLVDQPGGPGSAGASAPDAREQRERARRDALPPGASCVLHGTAATRTGAIRHAFFMSVFTRNRFSPHPHRKKTICGRATRTTPQCLKRRCPGNAITLAQTENI